MQLLETRAQLASDLQVNNMFKAWHPSLQSHCLVLVLDLELELHTNWHGA